MPTTRRIEIDKPAETNSIRKSVKMTLSVTVNTTVLVPFALRFSLSVPFA
jgi:preprotein translocase subunit SecF